MGVNVGADILPAISGGMAGIIPGVATVAQAVGRGTSQPKKKP